MKGYCRHREVIDALAQSLQAQGRMPTMKELCADIGIKRTAEIRIFERLVATGVLRKQPVGTLRFEFLDSRVTPSPASAEREKAAPVWDSSAGAATFAA